MSEKIDVHKLRGITISVTVYPTSYDERPRFEYFTLINVHVKYDILKDHTTVTFEAQSNGNSEVVIKDSYAFTAPALNYDQHLNWIKDIIRRTIDGPI